MLYRYATHTFSFFPLHLFFLFKGETEEEKVRILSFSDKQCIRGERVLVKKSEDDNTVTGFLDSLPSTKFGFLRHCSRQDAPVRVKCQLVYKANLCMKRKVKKVQNQVESNTSIAPRSGESVRVP